METHCDPERIAKSESFLIWEGKCVCCVCGGGTGQEGRLQQLLLSQKNVQIILITWHCIMKLWLAWAGYSGPLVSVKESFGTPRVIKSTGSRNQNMVIIMLEGVEFLQQSTCHSSKQARVAWEANQLGGKLVSCDQNNSVTGGKRKRVVSVPKKDQ